MPGRKGGSRKSSSDKAEERLLRRIPGDKSTSIARAKASGLIKQSGRSLTLTDKGRKAARKAKKTK